MTENPLPPPNFQLQVLKRQQEVSLCLTGTCNRNCFGVTNLYSGKFNTVLIKVSMGQIKIRCILAFGRLPGI